MITDYNVFVEPRVPYYISVVAINQVGEGRLATATVFTKPQSKYFTDKYI